MPDDATPPPPSPPASSSTIHAAFAINNIKNFIPLILDQEEAQYASRVEIFIIHACAYNVLDHIDSIVSRPSNIDDLTWKRLDASVKQWIYDTICKDLLHTITKPGSTTMVLWKSLEEIFQDNKQTRVLYLEEQFNTTCLENFTNMAEYCKQLKLLADQLSTLEAQLPTIKWSCYSLMVYLKVSMTP